MVFQVTLHVLISELQLASESPRQLIIKFKTQIAADTLRVSDFVGLRWGQRTGISNKFLDDADDAGPGTTLWGPCP